MARMTNQEIEDRLYRKGIANLLETNRPFRQFLLRMATAAGIYNVTHLPGHSDTSAFNEGRRSLGLDLLLELQAVEPMILARLITEEGFRIEAKPDDQPTLEDDE